MRIAENRPEMLGDGQCEFSWCILQCTLAIYLWILPEPSPPASFSTSATVTML